MGKHARARLVAGYLKYFKIGTGIVVDAAAEALGQDTLLLRFFCEAYGPQGKPAGYRVPQVNNIYKAQIFDVYLDTKLRTAAAARDRIPGPPRARGTEANLLEVIKVIVCHMVTQRKFADVPFTAVPTAMETDLVALLGEDIVIRRDLATDPNHLGAHQDVLNFTYDEFRDFLIARYLIQQVYPQGEQGILDFLAAGANGAENITEGVKRFLFYWSRLPAHATFRQFYAQQIAYAEAYPEEIFSVDEAHLDASDRERVRQIIEAGGEDAEVAAYRLIFRLPVKFPMLNLELLIGIVATRNDAFHGALIGRLFAPIRERWERKSAVEEFGKGIRKNILPVLNPAAHQPIFDFLPMLLPLEPEPALESPGMLDMREFIEAAPAVCILGLLRSLGYAFHSHRPYVWRLLTEFRHKLPDVAATRATAMAALGTANQALAYEINRFLAQTSAP